MLVVLKPMCPAPSINILTLPFDEKAKSPPVPSASAEFISAVPEFCPPEVSLLVLISNPLLVVDVNIA